MKHMTQYHAFISKQKGATLLITMIFMLLVALITATSLTNSTQQTKLMANIERKDSSFQESESTLAQMNNDTLFAKISEMEGVAINNPGTYITQTVSTVSTDSNKGITAKSEMRILGQRIVVKKADYDNAVDDAKSGKGMNGATMNSTKSVSCIVEVRSTSTVNNSNIATTIREGRPIASPTCQTSSD